MHRVTLAVMAAVCLGMAMQARAQTETPPAVSYPPVVPSREFPGFPQLPGQHKPDEPPNSFREDTFEGDLVVRQSAPRNSRLGIGELIRITYEFDRPQGVQLDLSAIQDGLMGKDKSDLQWRYPETPARCVHTSTRTEERDSRTRVIDRVELQLQHFIFVNLREEIEFHFDFRYAYQSIQGGTYPDFIDTSTAPMKLTIVRTGDRAMMWRYAPAGAPPVRTSALVQPLRYASLVLLASQLIYLSYLLHRWWRRGVRRGNDAVSVYSSIQAQTQATRTLTRVQCTELASSLRAALNVPALTGRESIERYFASPRQRRRGKHSAADRITAVLVLLDAVHSDQKRTVTPDEWTMLFDNIQIILRDR